MLIFFVFNLCLIRISNCLKDKQAKQGKDTKVVFTCKFSKANCKAKWTFKRDEVFQGTKYKMSVEEDGFVHKLTISNPAMEDMGKYTCDINNIATSAYLDVEGNLIHMHNGGVK